MKTYKFVKLEDVVKLDVLDVICELLCDYRMEGEMFTAKDLIGHLKSWKDHHDFTAAIKAIKPIKYMIYVPFMG